MSLSKQHRTFGNEPVGILILMQIWKMSVAFTAMLYLIHKVFHETVNFRCTHQFVHFILV